jgi:pimeloyl-ACP methyl ester carboxylesterase
MVDELIELETGARLHYRRIGSGDPLLLVMGTAACLGMWMPVEATLADRFDLVSFDSRGLGDSERGDGPITAATQAEDARALLDALSIPRAHVLGWSLGSVVARELALVRPDMVASLVLCGAWARPDGVMTALMTALKYPWEQGDLATALVTLGVVYSPEFLASPEFETFLAWTMPLTPSTPEQMRQRGHGDRAEPVDVVDIVTPPSHGRQVGECMPGATFEMMTGNGASHGLMFERTEDFLRTVLTFLDQRPLASRAP